MDKQQVFILKGLPASGKSTYAKSLLKGGEWKRVNKDDLRAMIDNGKWSKDREKLILKIRNQLILTYLDEGYNVVVDDTNLHPRHERAVRRIVGDKAECTVVAFHVPLKECMRRDTTRSAAVGPKVILSMYNQFVNQGRKLHLASLPFCPWGMRYQDRNWLTTNKYKRNAFIFDIDGTLAHINDRSPYDSHKVDQDFLNIPVAQIAKTLSAQYDIIIVTGRDGNDICRQKTLEWLKRHNITHTMLLMRAAGDMRKDAIIKREIYEQYIEPKYNVLAVFDDRNQMVDMWRQELNMACMQVDYGAF